MITAIMTGYERPLNLEPQLEAIKAQTIPPDRIMLWYNQGRYPQVKLAGVDAAYCNYNFKFHGRFAFGLLAQTEYVAIFDDDTIPGPKWFENCLETIETDPGILGTAGIMLRSNIYRGCGKIGWNGQQYNAPVECDLVGHAWFMKREYLKYLWYEEPLSWDNGEDIQLSYLAQKYGNVKTIVPPHPNGHPDVWGSIRGTELGNDAVATYISRSAEHYALRDKCVTEAIKGGWKPVFMRNENT